MSKILLGEVVDYPRLHDAVKQGLVKVQSHPDYPNLRIANYTPEAQFSKSWNDVTLNCRGLIWDSETWEVLARPFKKFFNYGESWVPNTDPPTYTDRLEDRVEVIDKVDGSLGILYFYDGLPWIATRGSFASDQAQHATALFRSKYSGWEPASSLYTALFEIVYPENRIVLDYGDTDDLSLLGSVWIPTGDSFGPQYIATKHWSGPKARTFHKVSTFEGALKMAQRQNAEGVVVRFHEDGLMLKIKQDDYKALHRLVFGLSEKYVWEVMAAGGSLSALSALPDEYHEWAKKVAGDLTYKVNRIIMQAQHDFIDVLTAMGLASTEVVSDRKAFSLLAQKKENCGLLFMLLDNKPITSKVWSMVRPTGDKRPSFVKTEEAA